MFVGARSNSQRLRADVDNLQTQCANDMWSAWNNTNTSLQQRVTETTEAHNKLQSHLSKEMQEIYDQARLNFLSNYNNVHMKPIHGKFMKHIDYISKEFDTV